MDSKLKREDVDFYLSRFDAQKGLNLTELNDEFLRSKFQDIAALKKSKHCSNKYKDASRNTHMKTSNKHKEKVPQKQHETTQHQVKTLNLNCNLPMENVRYNLENGGYFNPITSFNNEQVDKTLPNTKKDDIETFGRKSFGHCVVSQDEEIQILNHLLSLLRKSKGSRDIERKILDDIWLKKACLTNKNKANNGQETQGHKIKPARMHKKENTGTQIVATENPCFEPEVVGRTIRATKENNKKSKSFNIRSNVDLPKNQTENSQTFISHNNSDCSREKLAFVQDVYVRYGYTGSRSCNDKRERQYYLPKIGSKMVNSKSELNERRRLPSRVRLQIDVNEGCLLAEDKKALPIYPDHHATSNSSRYDTITPVIYKGTTIANNCSISNSREKFKVKSQKNSRFNVNSPMKMSKGRNGIRNNYKPLSSPLRGFTPLGDDNFSFPLLPSRK